MTAENSSSRFRRGIILALTVLLVLASYFLNSKLLETGWDSWGDIVFTSTLGSEPQQGQDIEPTETDDLSCHQPRPISLESLPKTLPKPIVHLGMCILHAESKESQLATSRVLWRLRRMDANGYSGV